MSHKLTKPLPTGKEYVAHCKRHPNAKSYRTSGDHFTVETELGRATICDSNRELCPWLRKRIFVELLAIGLGLVIVALVAIQFVA